MPSVQWAARCEKFDLKYHEINMVKLLYNLNLFLYYCLYFATIRLDG